MRGRKPLPSELKLMRGNPGKRPINPEPKPEPGIPDSPAHLSKHAKDEWDRITVELNSLGLLSQLDRAALSIYCTAWGRHVEAETHLLAEGAMLSNKAGGSWQNPWLAISKRSVELIKQSLQEFGLSPSARTRLSVKPSQSKTESLFG